MATVTTDLTTASAPRSRTERLTDGVVAGYIRALNMASQASASADAPAPATASPATATASLARQRNEPTARRAGNPWSRKGRGGCSLRALHPLTRS